MRRAALIYNLSSGVNRARRLARMEAAAQILRAAGIEVELISTMAAGSAVAQAREAAHSGCDVVVACGGDGTVNEVAQGILESGRPAALGIIPLGTANALAAELGLPWDAVLAAQVLANAEGRRVAVGSLQFHDKDGRQMQRCWLAAASVGVDAELMYTISTMHKARFGMVAYCAVGLRLLLTHDFAPFEVEFTDAETGKSRREVVAYFLLARVANFGRIFKGVAPAAALTRDDATLILFKTRRRLAYISFVIAVLTGRRRKIAGVESVQIKELRAQAVASPKSLPPEWLSKSSQPSHLRAEVDGEVVGTLPVRSSIIPDALTVLFPRMAR